MSTTQTTYIAVSGSYTSYNWSGVIHAADPATIVNNRCRTLCNIIGYPNLGPLTEAGLFSETPMHKCRKCRKIIDTAVKP